MTSLVLPARPLSRHSSSTNDSYTTNMTSPKSTAAALAVLILCSVPILAQNNPRLEVFGGYSLEHISTCAYYYSGCSYSSDGPASSGNFNGWNVAFTGYLYKFLGLTADFSGHYGNSLQVVPPPVSVSRYSYLFGPAFAIHADKVTPFAHALFGGLSNNYHGLGFSSDSYSAFAWAIGGGLDVNVSQHAALRLGQFDWEEVGTPGKNGSSPNNATGFRSSAGVVFKF